MWRLVWGQEPGRMLGQEPGRMLGQEPGRMLGLELRRMLGLELRRMLGPVPELGHKRLWEPMWVLSWELGLR